ncbi:MAG TPA: GntR family transcriptional regulator [Pirellulales bacterium]|jgi:GntR family transcriptional regulator
MASLFVLNVNDPLPLYAQLERAIKVAIVMGRLSLEQQLPTVRQLAVDLKINANTVARVYAELETQGILASRRGVGTFVKTLPAGASSTGVKRAQQLSDLTEQFLAEAAGRGFTSEEVLLQVQRLCAGRKEKPHGSREKKES